MNYGVYKSEYSDAEAFIAKRTGSVCRNYYAKNCIEGNGVCSEESHFQLSSLSRHTAVNEFAKYPETKTRSSIPLKIQLRYKLGAIFPKYIFSKHEKCSISEEIWDGGVTIVPQPNTNDASSI
jgi:hypothetical protein